ncbi:hypothetical protein ACFYP4_02685 [Streptomyces sp. NPDC005551]|uniref:hypothetical protein n=1 Tax=Streptomyces sp. NPDC005551 TaxID=3364725 RepID=UPI0036C56DA9
MPQSLSASGAASATPLLAATIRVTPSWRLTAAGIATATGRAITAARVLPSGGLRDLGVWATGQPDTAMSRDYAHAVGSDATTSRGWLTASAPTEYKPDGATPLWNAARYAAVGIKWASMPSAQKEAFHQVQFEKTAPTGNRLGWDATSWEARQCYIAQASAQNCIVATTSSNAMSGKSSGKITYKGAPPGAWGYWIIPVIPNGLGSCIPGEKINASVSVQMSRAAWWTAGIHFYDANYNEVGSWVFSDYVQHPGGNRWATSYVYSAVVPANAVYAAVVPHISINSTPSATDAIAPVDEVAYCDMHRIWSSSYNLVGTPTAYASPRKLTIDVKANRINLMNNPSFEVDLKGWASYGYGTTPYPLSRDATVGRQRAGSCKFTVPANVATFSGVTGPIGIGTLSGWSTSNVGGYGVKPSSKYMVSIYVQLAPGCPTVTMGLRPSHTILAGVTNTAEALAQHPDLVEGNWVRLWALVRTPSWDDGLAYVTVGIQAADVTAAGVAATFWLDDVLFEAGDQLLPYFDGSSPGSDYLWAGTVGYSSSHYYREFRANAYRLNDIVSAQVPHGTQLEIRYARPPQ